MQTLEQIITNAKRAIIQGDVTNKTVTHANEISGLKDLVKSLQADKLKAKNIIIDLTLAMEKWNVANSGKESIDFVPGDPPVENTPPVDSPTDYSVQFIKVTPENSAKIRLGQYPDTYHLYVMNPDTKTSLLVNGIPNQVQRHELGELLIPWFKGLNSKGKGSLRTLRSIKDQKSIDKYLTCGFPWRRNCSCVERIAKTEQRQADEDRHSDLLSDLETQIVEDSPTGNNDMDYLLSLVTPVKDSPPANLVDTAKTRRDLFFDNHDPSKGTEQEWKLASQAIRVSANKGVGHSGYLDRGYAAIIKIALSSDKITPELLDKS